MKKTLIAALAGLSLLHVSGAGADGMPDYAVASPAAVEVPVGVTWDGIYVGGGVGWRGIDTDHDYSYHSDGTQASEHYKPDDFIGYLAIGFDKQVRPGFIVGVFADFDLGKNSFSGNTVGGLTTGQSFSGKFDNAWAVGMRAGLVHDDRLFYYLNGGYTQADFKYDVAGVNKFDDTVSGWFIGAGLDWAIRDGWFLSMQYRFSEFSDSLAAISQTCFCGQNDRFQTDTQSFRVGLIYKFGERHEVVAAPLK